jgi:hypothetical protein
MTRRDKIWAWIFTGFWLAVVVIYAAFWLKVP